jgi:hypothetical protein
MLIDKMAYDLSFGPEFFHGPHDFDGIEFDPERPTSVYQAVMTMSDDDFAEMAKEVFGTEADGVGADMVMDKIRETNTCRDLRSPVEVYIDEEGYHSVLVYEEEGE